MALTFIDVIFFFYMFIGLYMISLFLFIYFPNRKRIFEYPKGEAKGVSIIVPCYNEGEHIAGTIEALLGLEYPKDRIEIIIVDDKSSDNSAEVVGKYADRYNNVRLIVNERNSGGAAEPTNIGIRNAKFECICVADADSEPAKDALIKMVGFLEEKNVAAVTCSVLVRNPRVFVQKLQEIEYLMISFGRKLLDFVDAVYVTPGPFALYKKDVLFEIGLFDARNLTQDIEIVWRLLSKGYKARMCLPAKVYSASPDNYRDWWNQRVRWDVGGTQTLWKYRGFIFKKGMLGYFIIPFFSFSMFIGLFGLGLFIYLFFRRIIITYLSAKYSIYASTAIVSLQDFSFTPSVLNFFGGALFFIGFWFTFFGLSILTAPQEKRKIFNILFYMIVYLAIYPIIMVRALYKLGRGKAKW